MCVCYKTLFSCSDVFTWKSHISVLVSAHGTLSRASFLLFNSTLQLQHEPAIASYRRYAKRTGTQGHPAILVPAVGRIYSNNPFGEIFLGLVKAPPLLAV